MGHLADMPRGHILVADDNAEMREYITRLLREYWTVEVVPDGAAALAAVQVRVPDLLLSDVMMPGLDGFELLRELRSDPRTKGVPVVLLSAKNSEDSTVEGLEAGADDYLTKPFSPRELIARVRTHLEMAEIRKEADRRKDEFLAMLAHELRNPLAAIRTAIHLMGMLPPGDSQHVELRAVCERQTGNLARLVDDLLDVSRITRGKVELRKEPTDFAAIVRSAVQSCRPLLDSRGNELSVSVAPGSYLLRADPTRIEQIVSNLLTNAVKYTDPGGHIAIELERRESPREAVLRVRDHGVGIPKHMLTHIFDLFVQVDGTLDRSDGGLGIGLTLVQRLVELHGGTVTATSEGLGAGSEFVVRLPLAGGSALRQKAPYRSSGSTPRRRVLIVEDLPDVRDVLRALLQESGHDVLVAGDGLHGAEMAIAAHPDIALVDIGLPGLDGYRLAERVRASPSGGSICLVALTGYGGAEARAKAERAGFDVHLTKPIRPEDLDQLLMTLRRAEPEAATAARR